MLKPETPKKKKKRNPSSSSRVCAYVIPSSISWGHVAGFFLLLFAFNAGRSWDDDEGFLRSLRPIPIVGLFADFLADAFDWLDAMYRVGCKHASMLSIWGWIGDIVQQFATSEAGKHVAAAARRLFVAAWAR